MLKQTIEDVHKFQDEETGMFWQVMDHPGVEGNYLETSGTALFAYAVLKGVRLGYLPKRMAAWAEKAFYGTCDKYLSKNPDGSLQLGGICLVAGLGGKDHRDGSLAYYFSEPVVCNLSLIHISVQGALTGDHDVVHLGDVQPAGKAVQRVALPAGPVVLVHLVLAGQYAGQDGVMGAVVVAQQHGTLFQIQGGVALQEQAGGAVAAGGHIHLSLIHI